MEHVKNTEEIEFTLGERIKRIRLMKNMRREDVATQAGISLTAIKNLESGHGATTKTLIKVLRVLDKVDWILALSPAATINPLKILHKAKGQRQRARLSRLSK